MSFKKGKRSVGGFVMLRHDIMKSPAWRSLSPAARCVWTEIVLRYNGDNNGELPLSCREAAALCNIGKGTAKRAFDELQDRGFIKIGRIAGFKNKKRYATRWIITHERMDGKKPTNEWRDYEPVKL